MSRPLLSLLALPVIAALGLSAAPAVATPSAASLDGARLFEVTSPATGPALATRPAGASDPVDPATQGYTIEVGAEAQTGFDATSLPTGSTVELELALVDAPGTLTLSGSSGVVWTSASPSPVEWASADPLPLVARLDAPGRYRLSVTGSVTGPDSARRDLAPVEYSIDATAPAGDTSPSATAPPATLPGATTPPPPDATTPTDAGTASDPGRETDPGTTSVPAAASPAPGAAYTVLGTSDARPLVRAGLLGRYDKSGEADSDVFGHYDTADSFTPIVVDRGLDDDDARVPYPAESTVIQLAEREYSAADGTWSTVPDDAPSGLNLGIGDAASGGPAHPNQRFVGDAVDRQRWTLVAVSGPQGGRMTVSDYAGVAWDSATLASTPSRELRSRPLDRAGMTMTLDAPGRYCLTTRTTMKSNSAGALVPRFRTFTVVAGELPSDLVPCEQVGDPGTPGPGDGDDDPVIVKDSGHTDLRAGIVAANDGSRSLRWGLDAQLTPVRDVVFSRTPPPATVPAPAPGTDLTGIGPVGSRYWYFPVSSTDQAAPDGTPGPDYLWPGFSTESIAPGDVSSPIRFRLNGFSLDGVDQPDGVQLGLVDGPSTSHSATKLNTRFGLPSAFDFVTNLHSHPLWWFTAEGQYCLNLTVSTTLRDGSAVSDDALVTFLVGDAAAASAASALPCERRYERSAWPTAYSKPDIGELAGPYVVDSALGATLEASFDGDGALRSTVLTGVDPAVSHDAGDGMVLAGERGIGGTGWRVDGLGLGTERVNAGGLAEGSGLSARIGPVRGPGTLDVLDTQDPTRPLLSAGRDVTVIPAGSRDPSVRWTFSQPGVYCVPITWTGEWADGGGEIAGITSELTFVAGQVADPSTIVPCAQGGQPGPLPDPGPDPDPPLGHDDVYVPNHSLTDSGAMIINEGHVDVASLLVNGALTTQLKDSSRSIDPEYHAFARGGSGAAGLVMQLLPEAKTTVPSAAYSFLGAPGSPAWQAQQTQQPGLVWPGWSTEAIVDDATKGGVDWALTGYSGPGSFALFQSSTVPGGPPVVQLRSNDPGHRSFTIPKHTHAHGTWSFSAEGAYCLAFTRSATLAGGANVKDDFVLAVAVGETRVKSVDPRSCFGGSVPSGANVGDSSDDGTGSGRATAVNRTACTVGGTVISSGHVDYGTRLVNGRIRSQIKDGSSGSVVWREPASTVIQVRDAAKVTSPGGAFAGLLGPAGATAWQIPQTQEAGIVWLGWNTEELNAGVAAGPVRWSLDSVAGPGTVSVYELGSFGSAMPVLQRGGSYSIPLGTHAHGNWAFSKPGLYRLGFTQSVPLAGGALASDRQTLTVFVGDGDAAAALASAGSTGAGCGAATGAAGQTTASATLTPPESGTVRARDGAADAASAASPERLAAEIAPWMLVALIGGGVLVLAAAASGGWLYLRHVRASVPSGT